MPVSLSERDVSDDLILACDTTQAACSVCVQRGPQLIDEIVEPMQRGHAEALVPMLHRVIERSGTDLSEVSRLAVTVGPGSFTGVRLGLSAMRAYALALDRPLHGIGSFQAMAVADPEPVPILVAVDVRRNSFYAQLFDAKRRAMSAPALVSEEALSALAPQERFLVVGSGAEHVMQLPFAEVSAAPAFPQARYVAALALNEEKPAGLPLPLYLRPADATLPDPASRPAHQL